MSPAATYDGVKIFSATRSVERERLGEKMNEWARTNRDLRIVDVRVLQSSDSAYHCLTFVAFWRKK